MLVGECETEGGEKESERERLRERERERERESLCTCLPVLCFVLSGQEIVPSCEQRSSDTQTSGAILIKRKSLHVACPSGTCFLVPALFTLTVREPEQNLPPPDACACADSKQTECHSRGAAAHRGLSFLHLMSCYS